ncbi:MAG: arylsulfatase [Acidobacteria bacterium]|nr:arylsulfatase [Acidobacteriota bacterium]
MTDMTNLPFGLEPGLTMATAKPEWPPGEDHRGKPNVIVMLVDDGGYSDIGPFGSEIPTPNLEAMAADGLRYTNFHVTPSCSPTRASLLTGCDPHTVGMGYVAQSDRGFDAHRYSLSEDVMTMAEVFKEHGYRTLSVGKWHLSPRSELDDGGPYPSWPTSRGFDRYYGFFEGFTNYHHPHRLYEDNHVVDTDQYPDGYYLTDDLTDKAVDMVRRAKLADPSRPFLLYYAHGAVHAPLQARPEDAASFKGMYDGGWDDIRKRRHERLVELGIIPEGTPLPGREEEAFPVPAWDSLSEDHRRVYARYMEVYAGMVVSIDRSLGRLREALTELGAWENTIVVFLSDNGASKEGGETGSTEYLRALVTWEQGADTFDRDRDRIDDIGGPKVLGHYPRGWAYASNTPFRFFKLLTYAAGRQVPMMISWPGRVPGGELRDQFTYVADILPTLLELAGLDHPASTRDDLRSATGVSFVPTIDDRHAEATRREQYWEITGHRGYYRDGWTALTLHEPGTAFTHEEWKLYETRIDPVELTDRTSTEPEKTRELAEAWDAAARRDSVYPIDEGSGVRLQLVPPSERPDLAKRTEIPAGMATLGRIESSTLIHQRAFRIEIDLECSDEPSGILVAHGDQGGGYALFIERGWLFYVHNAYGDTREYRLGSVGSGVHRIVADFNAPGGNVWTVTAIIDERSYELPEPVQMLEYFAPFEGIDVGLDRRSPVSWRLYTEYGAFPFSGTISRVVYTPGEFAPDVEQLDIATLQAIADQFD